MALHQDTQKKIQAEIDSTIIDNSPNLDDLPNLPFLEACLLEVERIRTVVAMGIPHSNSKDIEIQGYHIPKGSMIVPLLWAIHMNEVYWENPEEFRPERFLSDDGKCVNRAELIPFQIGGY